LESPYEQNFSPLHSVEAGSEANPAISPGVKRPGSEPDHSSPITAEVQNKWIYISTLLYFFMA
jgi:hypothetical protein